MRPCLASMFLGLCGWQALAADPTLVNRNPRYHLHPSDQIEVNFRLSPEFNATIPVQPDGYVTLPNLGDVRVGDLTLEQATRAIQDKAAERLNDPEVTVALKQFVPPYLIVGGRVANPGKVELHGPLTALQAVQLAGGFREGAKTNQILLIRRVDDQNAETKIINYKYILNHYHTDEDVALQAGDMLYVPESFVTKIAPYLKIANLGLYFDPLNF